MQIHSAEGVSALDVDLSLDEADCLQEINATPGLVYICLVGFCVVWILYQISCQVG